MRRDSLSLPVLAALAFGLLLLPLLAHAQVPTDPSALDAHHLAELALEAVLSGQWGLLVSVAILLGVVLARPLLAQRWPALTSPKGITATAVLVAFAAGLANALLLGSAPSLALVLSIAVKAVTIGLTSAGALFATRTVAASRAAGAAAAEQARDSAPTVAGIIGRRE